MKRKANNIILEFTYEQAEMFTELATFLKNNGEGLTLENAICECFVKAFGDIADTLGKGEENE